MPALPAEIKLILAPVPLEPVTLMTAALAMPPLEPILIMPPVAELLIGAVLAMFTPLLAAVTKLP